jgi:transcription elongation factor GreA
MMAEKKQLITKEGYERLTQQLEELRTVKRPAALQNLQDVSNSADWRENAQMIEMQNALGLIDAEIYRLEMTLETSEVAQPDNHNTVVDVGETVVLQCDGATETYTIVSPAESDPDRGYISYESPLGQALLHQTIGKEIEIKVPVGLLRYRIIAVQ